MNFDYCLETSFVSARRNSALSQALPNSNPRTLVAEMPLPQPTMDLNDITREFEKYKRKLLDERMMNLREMLLSPHMESDGFPRVLEARSETLAFSSIMSDDLAPAGSDRLPPLPLASRRTIDDYERMVAETRQCYSL